MILVQNKFNKRLVFVRAIQVVKEMDFDQIENLLFKIPNEFEAYWPLFKELGSSEKIDFNLCQRILRNYFDISKNESLTQQQYNNVMMVLKLLFDDELIFEAPSDNNIEFYFPNALHQMRPLKSLFYPDDLYYEKRLESQHFKEICLFDLNDLLEVIKKSISNKSEAKPLVERDKSLKDLMFSDITWKKIFQVRYFKSDNPTPLSQNFFESVLDADSYVINHDL